MAYIYYPIHPDRTLNRSMSLCFSSNYNRIYLTELTPWWGDGQAARRDTCRYFFISKILYNGTNKGSPGNSCICWGCGTNIK